MECAACVKIWTAKKENQKLGPEREGEGGGKEVEKKIEGAPSPHSQKLPRTVGAPLPSLSLPSLHTTSSFSRFVSRTVSMARSSAGLSSLLENNRCERKEREREKNRSEMGRFIGRASSLSKTSTSQNLPKTKNKLSTLSPAAGPSA